MFPLFPFMECSGQVSRRYIANPKEPDVVVIIAIAIAIAIAIVGTVFAEQNEKRSPTTREIE